MSSNTLSSRSGRAPGHTAANLISNQQGTNPNFYSPGMVPSALFYQSDVATAPVSRNSESEHVRDELYDVTDDESDASELVPFRISDSVKKVISSAPSRLRSHNRPTLLIPPPNAWPSIQKLQKGKEIAPLMQPMSPLSPGALAKLACFHNDPVSAESATPSLAGSLTSAEEGSCISTPSSQVETEEPSRVWDTPIRLNSIARHALSNLRTDFSSSQDEETASSSEVVEVREMQDRGRSMAAVFAISPGSEDREPLSAISLPSPGAYMSLSSAMNGLGLRTPTSSAPNTSTAERFYGVPWREPLQQTLDTIEDEDEEPESTLNSIAMVHSVSGSENLATLALSTNFDDPLETPRAGDFSAVQEEDTDNVSEYDHEYEDKLREDATSNMNRTSIWLSAQETYLSAFKGCVPSLPDKSSEVQDGSPTGSPVSGSEATFDRSAHSTSVSPEHAPLFDEAFQHLLDVSSPQDAFIQRRPRADAIQTQRLYLPDKHVAQLSEKFSIRRPPRHSHKWSNLPSAPDQKVAENHRDAVARANMERQALSQISMSFWELEARRYIMGGSIIHKTAARQLRKYANTQGSPQILELGGQAVAGWGWMAARKYPGAKVFTALPISHGFGSVPEDNSRCGPANHSVLTVPNSWTLPFSDNSFTMISASTLHALLRTCRPSKSPILNSGLRQGENGSSEEPLDEYEATLTELHRVLAPGGVLQFQIMDAEISGDSKSPLVAKSVEFAVALRSQSYDPSASTHFMERLQKAGFGNVSRTWMKLPLGSSKPKTKDPNEASLQGSGSAMTTPTAVAFSPKSSARPSIDETVISAPPELKRRLGWTSKANVLHRKSKSPQKQPPVRPLPIVVPFNLNSAQSGTSTPAAPSLASPPPAHHQLAEVDDVGIESLTGMLGSLSWERWILKLQMETGKAENQLLEGVAQAIEAARTSGTSAAWTMLLGCAIKK